jgi:hypothetical protein
MDSTDDILAHRQAIAAEIADNLNTTRANKQFPEQKRENYLVCHRKAYDRRRDKVLAHRKACYAATGRPIDKPMKSRKSIIMIK